MWQVVMWLLTYAFTASATSAHAFSFAAFPPEPPLNLPYRIDSRWWTSSTSIFFSMSVQLGLFLIAGDILSMQLSSSWIKFNAKSKSDCEAIISNSRRCYMWRHWLLRKQQLNIQACLFQRKQKNNKVKVHFIFIEAACNAAKKPRLFSNLSSRELNLRNVGGTQF